MTSLKLSLLTLSILTLSANPARAATSSSTEWLSTLTAQWSSLDGWTQHELAHVLGLVGSPEALDTLRRCARVHTQVSGSCVLGLAAQHDAGSTPIMRDVLRGSEDPLAVGVAALSLAAFEDRHSRDLLIKTMIESRAGWRAAGSVTRAYLSTDGLWAEMYTALGARLAPDVLSRAQIAAATWPVSEDFWRYQPPIEQALIEGLRAWWTTGVPDMATRVTAQTIIERLSSTEVGCQLMVKYTTKEAELTSTAHAAALIGHVAEPCRDVTEAAMSRVVAKMQAPHALIRLAGPLASPAPLSAGHDAAQWWADTLMVMEEQSGQALAPRARRALLQALVEREGELGLMPGEWGLSAAERLLRDAPAFNIMNQVELEEAFGGGSFPNDFYGYNPLLEQPDWWPSNIHLTIDDGPRLNLLPDIMTVLEAYGVRVSFFFVGAAIARRWLTHPEKTTAMLQRIIAGGHMIAFHSMNHITEPSEHLNRWEPEQVADSVALFRSIMNIAAGQSVPITYGRLPGGMGLYKSWVKRSFFDSGLHEHVHWNAGPPEWVKDTTPIEVANVACRYASRDKPVVVLLHEYSTTAKHLQAFFKTVKRWCPRTKGVRDSTRYKGVPATWPTSRTEQ